MSDVSDTEEKKSSVSNLLDDAAEQSDEGKNGSGLVDSSEEDDDEDDDEDAFRKVSEGFIVDDDDDDNANDGDDNEEGESSKRRKKHKKRKREQKSIGDENEELDEDDLDLLRENAGEPPSHITEKSKFKRLKRGGAAEEDESTGKGLTDIFSDEENEVSIDHEDRDNNIGDDNLDEDVEDDLLEASRQRFQQQRSKPQPDDMVGEFDDFIEDDEFSEDDEDRDERLARMRSARAKQTQFAQQSQIDQDKLDELFEIFGDGEEYAWALEAEEVEEEQKEKGLDQQEEEYDDEGNLIIQPKTDSQSLTNVFEYEELKEHLLTDKDQEIRMTDIPERFQVLREGITNYDLPDDEFVQKQQWIADTLYEENSTTFDEKLSLLQPFKEAVARIVEFVSRDNLEVPTIWNSRKDYTLYTYHEDDQLKVHKLLSENDLWRIVQLDIDYHAILDKKKTVQKIFESLDTVDLIYDEFFKNAKSIVELQDLYDYLQFTYSIEIKNIQEANNPAIKGENKQKSHSRFKFYERIKSDPIYKTVKEIGIDSEKFGENVSAGSKVYLTDDNTKSPLQLIKESLPDSYFSTTDSAMNAVKQMFSEQLVHNPKLRTHLRLAFQQYSIVDIELTEKGRTKINDSSPYADFKYAINRNAESFIYQPDLFLRMLEAESLGYVNIKIGLKGAFENFSEHLFGFMSSDGTSDISNTWNKLRKECLTVALKKLIPSIAFSIKENLGSTSERLLFFRIRDSFMNKIDQAPYHPLPGVKGTVPKVLALSNGEGKRDSAVLAIAMDYDGAIAEHIKFDENHKDPEFERRFIALVNRFKPEVIAISGYNVNVSYLQKRIAEIVTNNKLLVESDEDEDSSDIEIPVLYIPNETARMFEYSEKAKEEFSDKPVVAKFCIGIARYVQSPLLEYIALGDSITSIAINKYQSLLPDHKLKQAIDSIFVDVSCLVGIKINDAVRSTYQALMLPYIAGLGPRKASSIVKGIEGNGGALIRRDDLILKSLTTKNIFMNCAPFMEIPVPDRYDKDVELLDATRIHPEDYELARKMASDALDLEDEDKQEIENEEGGVIGKLYEEGASKLDDLLLEGYANQLEEHGHKKRATLEMIKEELQNNYEELRKSFHIMTDVEVFEMLTSESKETFERGIAVPVIIQRVDNRFLLTVTQSGISGNISRANAVPYGDNTNLLAKYTTGQAIQAVVKSVEYTDFKAELSLLKEDIVRAKSLKKAEKPKGFWNFDAENKDIKREREVEMKDNKSNKRLLKHPYFRNFDAKQAEDYLASRDNGDFVIRPSSKGNDHLTITWKVDNQLFQHIDVVELDKPNEYSLGRVLQVGDFKYHDLDELIVSHINELYSKVESLKNHEKFNNEPVNDARNYLIRYSKANKNRSCYCFCFNRKAPGWFFLLFKLNDTTEKTYTWNVKALPTGYQLHGNVYPDMVHLCNGFKKMLQNQVSRSQQRPSYGYGGGY